jgi:hypothetical protein
VGERVWTDVGWSLWMGIVRLRMYYDLVLIEKMTNVAYERQDI